MAATRALLAALAASSLLQVRGKEYFGFDCESGYTHWRQAWPMGKRRWCCSYVQRGCANDRRHKEIFDCDDSLTTWRHAWSREKKDWCCENSKWSDTHQNFCCEIGKGCHTTEDGNPFNCRTGVWTNAKKGWCCKHDPPHGCDATTSLPFDCQAGLARAKDGWSHRKKAWCCAHQNLGCPMQTQPPSTTHSHNSIHLPPGFHRLHHKLREEHSGRLPARDENYQPPVETTTPRVVNTGPFGGAGAYNCSSGFANKKSWQKNKICYCCQHFGIACPPVFYPPNVPDNVIICSNSDLSQGYEIHSDARTSAQETSITKQVPMRGPLGALISAASLGLLSLFVLAAVGTGARRLVRSGYDLVLRRQRGDSRYLEAEETPLEVF